MCSSDLCLLILNSVVEQKLPPGAPQFCTQLLGAVRTRDSSSAAAAASPALLDARAPFGLQHFRREERGPQRPPGGSFQVVRGPMREERLQAGEQGWGPQSLVLLPSSCARSWPWR